MLFQIETEAPNSWQEADRLLDQQYDHTLHPYIDDKGSRVVHKDASLPDFLLDQEADYTAHRYLVDEGSRIEHTQRFFFLIKENTKNGQSSIRRQY